MQHKKVIRTLRFSVIALIVATVILFALSLHTLIYGLIGAISDNALNLELNKDAPEGDWLMMLTGNPKNNGFLSERLSFSIGLRDANNNGYIVTNSTVVTIAPGEQKFFSLTLTIPFETVQRYNLNETQSSNVDFELLFGIYTLGDFVGFQQTMIIPAGENP
jgi:hypothetical protein